MLCKALYPQPLLFDLSAEEAIKQGRYLSTVMSPNHSYQPVWHVDAKSITLALPQKAPNTT